MFQPLVVDANPLVSALLGGRAREIVFSDKFQLSAAQAALFEVAKYIPRIAAQAEVSEAYVFREFHLMPIKACQPREFDSHETQAAKLIANRDPRDVPTLALALARDLPIWSNDNDFQELPGVHVFTTAQLLDRLARS